MRLARKYFTEEKTNNNKITKKEALATAAGVGMIGSTIPIQKRLLAKYELNDILHSLEDDNNKIADKLFKKIKKSGGRIIETNKIDHAGYTPASRKPTIVISKYPNPSASTIAHEYGHFVSDKGLQGSTKAGRIAHKVYLKTGGALGATVGSVVGAAGAGYASGYNSEVQKSKGKKEHIISKVAPYAVPVLISAPMLVSEAAASKAGLKALKEAGASEQFIKHSKNVLKPAFGTYATSLLPAVGTGVVSRQVGKVIARKNIQDSSYRRENENN